MFSQVTTQPQVTTILCLVSRQTGGVIYPKGRGRVKLRQEACTEEQEASRQIEEHKEEDVDLGSTLLEIVRDSNWSRVAPALGMSPTDTPWNVSYVSSPSFFENKTGFDKSYLFLPGSVQSVISQCRSPQFQHLLTNPLPNLSFQQERGFKTARAKITSPRQESEGGLRFKFLPTRFRSPSKSVAAMKHSTVSERLAYMEGMLHEMRGNRDKSWKPFSIFFIVLGVYLLMKYLLRPPVPGGGGELGGFKIMMGNNHEVQPEEVKVKFSDVKGVDEAKDELMEVVQYLQDPARFEKVGAKLPRGVLLVGEPGIGKTLMAKAIAGEANVPFFHASGSEFDELFVGSGARKVRNLFAAARKKAPCLIFIDEIDSVGAKRTSTEIHPYANQTINQLLTEMDGFSTTEGVIILGATNKKENLDRALLRPGRFDVEINVLPPDVTGRKEIFQLYLDKVVGDKSIDLDKLAHLSYGMTGADIENIVNQAALKAALDRAPSVRMEHIEYARDKIIMGPAWKNKKIDEETNWNTSYHEAGHTIVAFFTKGAKPLNKVTIVPRGNALGVTSFMSEKEVYGQTKAELMALMDVAMGGGAAEEFIYGPDKVTTGAAADYHTATSIATSMVKTFGMSEKVGRRVHKNHANELVMVNEVSPSMQDLIDSEISRLLQESYQRAKNLLQTHDKEHKLLAEALMKYETLDKEEVTCVIKGQPIRKAPKKKIVQQNTKNGKNGKNVLPR